tara:strand:- start:54 stop:317 length:264 start_codon:yes stop_codon:yes gene_type:complete
MPQVGFSNTLEEEVPHLLSQFDGVMSSLERNKNHSSLTEQESEELKRIWTRTHLARLQLKHLLERQSSRQYIKEKEKNTENNNEAEH